MVAVVGRAEAAHKGLAQVHVRAAAVGPEQGLGTVFGLDGLQLVSHIVQGFVPGGDAPFALAPLARADERSLRALVVVEQGRASRSARAQRALEPGRVRIPENAGHASIFNVDSDGATDTTHPTHAEDLLPLHDDLLGVHFVRPANVIPPPYYRSFKMASG